MENKTFSVQTTDSLVDNLFQLHSSNVCDLIPISDVFMVLASSQRRHKSGLLRLMVVQLKIRQFRQKHVR